VNTCTRAAALAFVALLAACPGGGDDGVDPGPRPGEPDAGPGPGPIPNPFDRTPPTTTASPDAAATRQTAIAVTLSPSEPATTYYTLDGSEPTAASARYAAPIVVDRTRTLRFFSVDVNGNAEAPQSLRYRIDIVRRLLLDVAAN
jgi:hypothetical protein